MRPYLIAAPPRSGTSLVANLLYQHGVWVGDTNPELADEHNKYGYFENIQIVDIVKRLFWDADFAARSDVPCFIDYNGVGEYDVDWFRQQILEVVGDNDPWLYKDSKILHVYPLFEKAFPEATWILPQRNALSIYNSIEKHKIWKRRMSRKVDKTRVKNMISRLHERQYEIISRTGDRSVLVDVDKLVFDIEYAEGFVTECGLCFDQAVYSRVVDLSIWSTLC